MKICLLLTLALSYTVFSAWHDQPRAQQDCIQTIRITDNCNNITGFTKLFNGLKTYSPAYSMSFECSSYKEYGPEAEKRDTDLKKETITRKQTVYFESNFALYEGLSQIEDLVSGNKPYDLEEISYTDTAQICKLFSRQLIYENAVRNNPKTYYQTRTISEIADETIKSVWDRIRYENFEDTIDSSYYTKFYFKK